MDKLLSIRYYSFCYHFYIGALATISIMLLTNYPSNIKRVLEVLVIFLMLILALIFQFTFHKPLLFSMSYLLLQMLLNEFNVPCLRLVLVDFACLMQLVFLECSFKFFLRILLPSIFGTIVRTMSSDYRSHTAGYFFPHRDM